jgi:hypothetical protein
MSDDKRWSAFIRAEVIAPDKESARYKLSEKLLERANRLTDPQVERQFGYTEAVVGVFAFCLAIAGIVAIGVMVTHL